MTTADETHTYVVVINDEEQYSLWRADRPIPPGWRDAGKRGAKAECLEHISKVWTDMRPLSVRAKAQSLLDAPEAPPERPRPSAERRDAKNDLVARLESEQPILLAARPHPSAAELKAQLDRGVVVVLFERTGTELSVRLDEPSLVAAREAVERNDAPIALQGELVLNYNRVRFVGELQPDGLRGVGRLAFLGEA